MLVLVFVYSCGYGLRLGRGCTRGGGGMRVGGEQFLAAPGSALRRAVREPVGRRGGVGGVRSPRKRPRESVGRGAGAPPGSTRKRNQKHHLPCNALDRGSAT